MIADAAEKAEGEREGEGDASGIELADAKTSAIASVPNPNVNEAVL